MNKTYTLTLQQEKKALIWLALFHIMILIASNFLVQLPVTFFGVTTTWGAFSFPFIFLTTDLTVRIFSAPLARRIIFVVMMPALILSYIISVLFQQGQWMGFDALLTFNTFVGRIALASFMAYVIGQLFDVIVFNRLRQLKSWWVAPMSSTVLGSLLDTIVFFTIAFYKSSDTFMSTHLFEIATVDYGVKLMVSLLFFLPAYGVLLSILMKKLKSNT
ncbi:MAG: 7-cyano-7-deazaguanine/7-aminomethyl-7-deazaguanine transporter [Alcaligenaceae bacterium]|nr:7-cyano-7-deazaguanine/7-aminomethyl-7-deazaguanine transporter [Alcaligenaceae bacterium]